MEPLSAQDPRRLGHYRVQARLSSGGMGRVYLGFSPAGRAVALKVLREERAHDPAFRTRFWGEVSALRQVGGPFTAPVLDAGIEAGRHWLATAFVAGPSLLELVGTNGPMPLAAAWRLAGGLIEALTAVHACGLVHRDLKPANVLLAADGPRVIDFGLSQVTGGQALTLDGMVCGTPGFMSPEQAKGEPVGPASDVFALGCLLVFASTGKEPFGTGNPASVMYRVVHSEPDLSGVPEPTRDLVDACLARDPAHRPSLASLAELMEAVEARLPGEPAGAPSVAEGAAAVAGDVTRAPEGATDSLIRGEAVSCPLPGEVAGSPTSFWPDRITRLIQSHQARLSAEAAALAVPPGLAPEGDWGPRPWYRDGGAGSLAHGPGPAVRSRKRLTRRQAVSLLLPAAAVVVGAVWTIGHLSTPQPPASAVRPAPAATSGRPAQAGGEPKQAGPRPSVGQPSAQPAVEPTVQPVSAGGMPSAPTSRPLPPGLARAHSHGNPDPPGQAKK